MKSDTDNKTSSEEFDQTCKILQKSIELGDVEKVKALLEKYFRVHDLESGENNDLILVRDSGGNSVLHLGVMHSQPNIIEILRKDGQINLDVRNKLQQTPLHLFHCEKGTNCPDHNCIDALVALKCDISEETVNAQDNDGNTALHLSVKQKCAYCIQNLLSCGAVFNIKSNDFQNYFVTPGIFDEYPWAGDIFESRLNKAVAFEQLTLTENHGENSRFRILMDFSQIVSKSENKEQPSREMEFLATFLLTRGAVRKQILGHPLISNFIFFKSERVQWIFMLSLILHIALATVYTIYVLTVYLSNCPYSQNDVKDQVNVTFGRLVSSGVCDKGLGSIEFSIFLLIVAGVLGFLEIMKFLQNMFLYIKTWRNFFQLGMIICMYLTVWPVRWTSHKCLYSWQYSTAAYGIFHVWSTLMINVGRFPVLGIYVEMFGKVLRNFGYLMLAYVFLMIAFSISFCVIFPEYPPFETIPRAVLKVITMMSGEVDYGDFFYGDHKGKETGDFIFKKESTDLVHPITAHLLYGAFVILVTIVLTNLLIGLAVDDIKGLQQNAEFTKTTREVANIDYLESVIFWHWIPNWKLVAWLRKSVFLGKLVNHHNHQRKGSLFEVIIRSMTDNFLCKRIFNSVPSNNTQPGSIPFDKTSSMYCFGVCQEDCKAPRYYPEEVLLRTVELINKSNKHSEISVESFRNNHHCPTCRCGVNYSP